MLDLLVSKEYEIKTLLLTKGPGEIPFLWEIMSIKLNFIYKILLKLEKNQLFLV